MNWIQIISALSEVAVAISGGFLAWTAHHGLKQWHNEMVGKARFEAARNLGALARQFEYEFIEARGPYTVPAEWAEAKRDDSETPNQTRILDEFYARKSRLKPLIETIQKLHRSSWEAELLFEKSFQHYVESLGVCLRKLDSAINQHFYYQQKASLDREVSLKKQKQSDKLVMIIYGADDEYSKQVHSVVSQLTDELKSYTR